MGRGISATSREMSVVGGNVSAGTAGCRKEKAPHDSRTDYRPGRWAGSVYQE